MAGYSVGLKTPAIELVPEVPVSLSSGRALLSGPGGIACREILKKITGGVICLNPCCPAALFPEVPGWAGGCTSLREPLCRVFLRGRYSCTFWPKTLFCGGFSVPGWNDMRFRWPVNLNAVELHGIRTVMGSRPDHEVGCGANILPLQISILLFSGVLMNEPDVTVDDLDAVKSYVTDTVYYFSSNT